MKKLDVVIWTGPQTCTSVFSLGATHLLHSISDVWLFSAIHFYDVGGISGYAKKNIDQARTDQRNIIHVSSHWVPAYGLLNFLLREDYVQKRLVTSELCLDVVYGLQAVWTLWVMSLHWDVSLLQSEEIDLFCCCVASFPH